MIIFANKKTDKISTTNNIKKIYYGTSRFEQVRYYRNY
jgi:hypothetical protein